MEGGRKGRCCVPNCTDRTSKRHRFPKNDPKLMTEWINRINPEKFQSIDRTKLYKSFYVCDTHFSEEAKVVGTLRGIRLDAVPTLNLPGGRLDTSSSTGNEEGSTKEGDTKSLPSIGSCSIENKENSAISGGAAKLVPESGQVPIIYVTPLKNLEKNNAPSTGFKNEKSIKNDGDNDIIKTNIKDHIETWEIDNTYDVARDSTAQDQDIATERVCRTCLRIFDVDNTVVIYQDGTNTLQNGIITRKEKLHNILPFIDLNLSEKPVVVCMRCEKLIHQFFNFKQMCKSSEMRLRHVAIATRNKLPNLLKIVNYLPPLSEVDKNILQAPYIFVPVVRETDTNGEATKKVNDEIAVAVVYDETVTDQEITLNEKITEDDIVNEATPGVLNDKKNWLMKNVIPATDLLDVEINLSDMEDGWHWDTIRCDPLEKPKPNQKSLWMKDHDYASEWEKLAKFLPKSKSERARFNWKGREIDVLSEEFGDYLKHRKGKAPECYVVKRLNTLKRPINGESPYICEFCGRVSQTYSMHYNHTLIRHGKAKKNICPACGKLILAPYFRQHMLNHSMERETSLHVCHKCGKCFPKRISLLTHIKIHEVREKKFQCPICNKMFHTRVLLNRHKVYHGEKQFKCKYCFMSFHYPRRLREHLRMKHETRATYQCPICNKVLKFKECFEDHINAHVNNNKFKCDHCPKSFRKKITREIHTNKIHLNIHFKCKYCERKFYTQFNLNVHLEYIHGKKLRCNFWCHQCNKGYVRDEPYKQHLITTHGINVEEVEDHVQMLLSVAENEPIEFIEVKCEKKERNCIERESSQELEEENYHKEENGRSIEENDSSIEENDSSREENGGPIEENCRSIGENCRSIGENCRSIEDNCRSIEDNSRSIEDNCRSIEENSRSIEENSPPIEENCHAMEEDSYYVIEESYHAIEDESSHVKEENGQMINQEENCYDIKEGSYHVMEEESYHIIVEDSCHVIEEQGQEVPEETISEDAFITKLELRQWSMIN